MATHPRPHCPEIQCDFNARLTERAFSLESHGSVLALQTIGLTLETAVGKQFTFFDADTDDEGRPDDVMFNGFVTYDKKWGYLAVMDSGGLYWRSQTGDASA